MIIIKIESLLKGMSHEQTLVAVVPAMYQEKATFQP